MGKVKKNKRRSGNEPETDVLDLHDDVPIDSGEETEWLTNRIMKESKTRTKKGEPEKRYSVTDVCVIGLERIISIVRDDAFETMTLTAIEGQMRLTEMYHKKFFETMLANSSSLSAAEIVAQRKEMDRLDDLVEMVNVALKTRKTELVREESQLLAQTSTSSQSQEAMQHDVRVKRVEIEKFAGDDTKWPQFKAMFEDCFHKRTDFSGTSKMYHLMAHLETNSEAYNTICELPRNEEGYITAWNTLCEAYDNERKIVNDIVLAFVDMPAIDQPSRAELIRLINKTNNLIQSLPRFGIQVQHWDPIIVPLLFRKMDAESIQLWSLERPQKEISKLAPLLEFMRKRADGMDADFVVRIGQKRHSCTSGATTSTASNSNNNNGNPSFVSNRGHFRGADLSNNNSSAEASKYQHDPANVKRRKLSCYHCYGSHQLYNCTTFDGLSFELQEERLKSQSICTKCLRKGHAKETCKMSNCHICNGPHNRILCPKRKSAASVLSVMHKEPSVFDIDATLIATLRVFATGANGNSIRVRAMSDGGSHMNMVSERLVQSLKLGTTRLSVPVQGAGKCDIKSKAIVDLKIAPANNGENDGEWIRAGVLKSISDKLPSTKFEISEWKHIQGLPLADTNFNEPDDIDILLSVEFMARIQADGLRRGENVDKPIACNTSFGWIVYGALPSVQRHAQVSHLAVTDGQRIAESLEMLWKVDAVEEKTLLTDEEKLCKRIFNETVSRAHDGRYIVTMPMMLDPPKLGNSLRAAIARQLQNEKRFRRDSSLKANYIKDMRQFIDMDHMESIPPNEINRNDDEIYYIPHHAARATKFRVVFDGSVKTTTGVSLNDILLNGPRLQEDLTMIIMRFRTYSVALTTDIAKMYRQVMVPANQRDLLRIVWRENEGEPLKHYRMKRQTYGLKSSAYCCIEALRRCAIDYQDEYPVASKAVLQSFYVDDGTLGANSDNEAEELYRQLNSMLRNGGFPLAKWATNSKQMQSIIGATAESVDLDLFNENSVLGLKWSVRDDSFRYNLCEPITDQIPTKRFIVASIARLYDPNGWIAPIVVLGKILIQDIWRCKCDWDATVPIDLQKRWHEFRVALGELAKISIPRWIGMAPAASVQIHGFSDASKKSYGVAFYVRVERDNEITCNLVMAKSRVAPVKGMTIPRLELCAALMMAQVCKTVCDAHNVDRSCLTFWIDSSIVIHWLSKCPANLKTFVANRVAEAQELSRGVQWRHVRTHDNPSDLASRGVITSELVDNSFWFNGPKWLRETSDKWPVSEFVADWHMDEEAVAEVKPVQTLTITKREIVPRIEVTLDDGKTVSLMDYCSSMAKLVRVTARILRVCEMAKKQKSFQSLAIATEEYLNAQAVWIRHHQSTYFAKELMRLSAHQNSNAHEVKSGVGRGSPILKLTPFVDGQGIMRVGGRIKRSLMSFDTKHPIIISNECRFAHLLALEAHQRTLHGGNQLCMQYIRQRFWIPNIRKVIKRVSLKCISCFRQRKELSTQLMGDLPSARVTSGFPFESVGVDYCGPIQVKERTGRTKKTYKAYIVVFICLKVKAVHLDLVTDLTSDAFMACLTRLHSARGSIREIFSDNATTFHGANNEMREIFQHWGELKSGDAFGNKQIKWTFITPMSPSQGGLWERAVRSVKHHLRRVIGAQTLTYEEYTTVLAQVSMCLNSRPLVALDDDPTACEALTPAHLLFGRRLVGPIQYDYTKIPDNRLQRWRLLQKMSQQFWDQWHREYITHLVERNKWNESTEDIKIGAVVLLKLENSPPTHWPLGRIVSVFPGEDGRVRNVEVMVGKSSYRRSINKVAVLPIDDASAED